MSLKPVSTARIGQIRVMGNTVTDSTRILRTFEVTTGTVFSDETLRRGIRKLYALGLFEDVWLEKLDRGGEIDVVIHVRERPRISKLTFTGNKKRETSELERKLFLRPGSVYSPTSVISQVDTLRQYYRDEGFSQASIDAVVDSSAGGNQVALNFVIREGERVKVKDIDFVGITGFSEKKLRKQLKTKARGFFGGGDVKEENFTEDKREARGLPPQQRLPRCAAWSAQDLVPGAKPRELKLVIRVDQGPLYRFGEVAWSGNQVIETPALAALWTTKPGDVYDASKIEKALWDAYAAYAEKGYLYLNLEPREVVRGENVDLTFGITEGLPSSVRLVNIAGNKSTREKVIRREIDVHEGDRFRRSALVRTQGDIFRLGLFEDVQVGFTPADSTDVDINLTVKEKQVGTASAGAGYTSESGLTGFLELGHNNVLGNGQSLQLHLERGGQRSDYSLSFTEPWFRDTPTLLGFSVFSTDRERDLFDEKRVGGSVRIGRPLPWPDYTRGSVAYRLEEVTIRQLGDQITVEDSIALSGVEVGKPTLTSALETSFRRDNTDNPFYPTGGSRLILNDEFAGGPFGGSIHFHKHRIDGRLYFPSLVKGVTTMLRARVGMLGEYGDQISSVPPYERFRLGGGTTPDPLRGYDDYQVVPDKYNRFLPNVVSRPDTLDNGDITTVQDTIGFVRVRYPGGRFMAAYSIEQQFPIVHPLRAVIFFDAGNVWDLWDEIQPLNLKLGAGIGFRLEIPFLGNIGFDYGYGFNRDDGARARGHFLIGNF